MVPVVVPVPRAITADLARPVIGPDDPAVTARVIIIGRRVIGRSVEEAPVEVMAVVNMTVAAVAIAAAVKDRRWTIAAAIESGTTAIMATAAVMATATIVPTTAVVAAAAMVATATAVPNLGYRAVG